MKIGMTMLATTSHFTRGVHDYKAKRYDLALRDFEGIVDWIRAYKKNPNGRLYMKDSELISPNNNIK